MIALEEAIMGCLSKIPQIMGIVPDFCIDFLPN